MHFFKNNLSICMKILTCPLVPFLHLQLEAKSQLRSADDAISVRTASILLEFAHTYELRNISTVILDKKATIASIFLHGGGKTYVS